MAHEDDAERAVRAALELVDAVSALGEEMGAAPGARVDLVSQMLGHSSAGLTLSIYAHLMPGDQESAVHRLDLLLAGA